MSNRLSNNQVNELALWKLLIERANYYSALYMTDIPYRVEGYPEVICVINHEIWLRIQGFECLAEVSENFKIKLDPETLRVHFTEQVNPYHETPASYGRTKKFLDLALEHVEIEIMGLHKFVPDN